MGLKEIHKQCIDCCGNVGVQEKTVKKESLRCLRYKTVVLLKHRHRTRGQKEQHWVCEEWLIIYLQVGSGVGTA